MTAAASGGLHVRRALAMVSRPPGRAFHALLGVPALVLLVTASSPVGGYSAGLAATLALAVLAPVWLVRSVAAGLRGRWSWWLLVAPAGAALAFATVQADLPLRARFALSRAALDRVVDQGARPTSSTAGLYSVRAVTAVPGGVQVALPLGTSWAVDDGGFARLPRGPARALQAADAAGDPDERYTHLSGDWYVWQRTW